MERNYFLIIALFFTFLIAWGSFLSSDDFAAVTFNLYDKIVHIGSYSVLGFSWFLAIRPKISNLKTAVFIVAAVTLYGIIIEVLQGLLSAHRKADIFDILANFIGVMLAFMLFYFISNKIDSEP